MHQDDRDTRSGTLRRSFLFAAIASLLSASAPRATSFQYDWGHPRPQGNTVYGLAFADAANGWAVGGSGFILRTTNGGEVWDLVHRPFEIAPDLYDVAVLPSGTVLACGAAPGLYRSSDGGATWTTPAHPGATDLRDLTLRPGGVTAAGVNGSVLLSTDDGLTWSSIGSGVGVISQHLWRSASEGYAVGDGAAHRTTNGGLSWTAFLPTSQERYNEIYFSDASNGTVVQDFGTWNTTNGGLTWTEHFHPVPPLYRFRSLVVSPTHWFTVAHIEGGEFWETTDAGENWTERLRTDVIGFPCLIQAPGGRIHFASNTGDLYRTDDFGQTFQNATVNLAEAAPSAPIMAFVSRPDGVLFAANQPSGGEDSAWLRSDDNGQSWTVPASGPGLYWIDDGKFFDSQRGVVGSYEEFRATTNGGASWVSSNLPTGFRLSRLATPASNRYFAATYRQSGSGGVFRSTDSGLTWTQLAGGLPASGVNFSDVAFPTPLIGFVSGSNTSQLPRLYRTTDGGVSWSLVTTSGLDSPIRGMAWFDAQTAILTQGFPTIGTFRTTNGGANWQMISTRLPFSIAQRNSQEALLCGDSQLTFLLTHDAGATWEEIASPMSGAFPGLWLGVTEAAPIPNGWVLGGPSNRILTAIDPYAAAVEEPVTQLPPSRLHVAPNPFLPREGADAELSLEVAESTWLRIHDLQGRRVRSLLATASSGRSAVASWDGRDDLGRPLGTGVYWIRAEGPGTAPLGKVLLVR